MQTSSNIRLLPQHRQSQYRPPHNRARGQQDLPVPPRIHPAIKLDPSKSVGIIENIPPPYPHRHTSARMHASSTSGRIYNLTKFTGKKNKLREDATRRTETVPCSADGSGTKTCQ